MKKLIIPIFTIFLTACSPSVYYQVYKTVPDNGTIINHSIVFEDKNCKVSYDLWADEGDIGFTIYNKTENDLTIDLTKTFYVLNGVANEYFQNRVFSKSVNNATAVTKYKYPYYLNYYNVQKVEGTTSTTYGTSYTEKPELTIPPQTSITISEYHITSILYKDCKYSTHPKKKSIKTLSFDKTNSPLTFYNIITYKTKGETIRLENKFYASELTNLPPSKMFVTKDTSICGEKLDSPLEVFKRETPDKFYIKYSVKWHWHERKKNYYW